MKLTKTIISQIGILCLITLITLLTLVSCGGGGDDDLGAPQTVAVNDELVPITFNGSQSIEAAVTRAGGTPLSEKAQQFHVWGYKNMSYSASAGSYSYDERQTVFPGYQVDWGANTAYTTTSNTNNWEYVGISDQTIKYWDWSANAYRFFAVTGWSGAPPAEYVANKAYGAYGAYDETYDETYEVSMLVDASSAEEIAAAPYFSRLWFSTGDAGTYPDKQFGKPVTLEFVKPFSRVRFIYNYVYPREGITLEDQRFKPTDTGEKIYRKGVVTVTYPLEGTDIKESYSMEPTDAGDLEHHHLSAFTEDYDPEDDTKTCWYTVLPNPIQGSYTLTVRINNVEKTAVVPAEYMKWLPGYSYTYIFKITDKGGVEIGWVEYAVTPWIEVPAGRTVYDW